MTASEDCTVLCQHVNAAHDVFAFFDLYASDVKRRATAGNEKAIALIAMWDIFSQWMAENKEVIGLFLELCYGISRMIVRYEESLNE